MSLMTSDISMSMDSLSDIHIRFNGQCRFAKSAQNPKYMVRGFDGKTYGTNDPLKLHLLGLMARDCRPTPGGYTYSCGMAPESNQPTGSVNWTNIDLVPITEKMIHNPS